MGPYAKFTIRIFSGFPLSAIYRGIEGNWFYMTSVGIFPWALLVWTFPFLGMKYFALFVLVRCFFVKYAYYFLSFLISFMCVFFKFGPGAFYVMWFFDVPFWGDGSVRHFGFVFSLSPFIASSLS